MMLIAKGNDRLLLNSAWLGRTLQVGMCDACCLRVVMQLSPEDVERVRDHLTAMLDMLDAVPILGHDDGVSLPEPIE